MFSPLAAYRPSNRARSIRFLALKNAGLLRARSAGPCLDASVVAVEPSVLALYHTRLAEAIDLLLRAIDAHAATMVDSDSSSASTSAKAKAAAANLAAAALTASGDAQVWRTLVAVARKAGNFALCRAAAERAAALFPNELRVWEILVAISRSLYLIFFSFFSSLLCELFFASTQCRAARLPRRLAARAR